VTCECPLSWATRCSHRVGSPSACSSGCTWSYPDTSTARRYWPEWQMVGNKITMMSLNITWITDIFVCLLLDNLCIVRCCLSKMTLMFIIFGCWGERVVVGAVEVTRLLILHTCAVWHWGKIPIGRPRGLQSADCAEPEKTIFWTLMIQFHLHL
jgi:hypothetical protein